MDFAEKLTNYAKAIVGHGLNVQPGQIVNISTEALHRDFAIKIAEAAYDRGARFVNIDLSDVRLSKLRLQKAKEEDLEYVPPYLGLKYRELVDETAANLRLIGAEDPDILADVDPKRINTVRLHHHLAIKYFYDEGIGKSKVHWTVAAAASPGWAAKLFPDLPPDQALARLWDEIFRICRADAPDALAAWEEHSHTLQKRAQSLNDLGIETIHFTGGGTDLRVGLSSAARFRGGTDISPRGVPFEPNMPTEEVFTTPDCRRTEGTVRATRPFLVNGKLIQGLELSFKDGEITDFKADDGEATFREYIKSDPGACRLGEVALVGVDSPVYRSGVVFQEILYDENAACHIAVGSAYKFCLAGGTTMSKEELAAIGCNESTVHTDMMISSEEVDVIATTYDGRTVPLLEKGRWVLALPS
ncbi:MAG: aminopeptidase [Bdellovibrionales bacterium]|nr:aminopeptidase [Bdellovibrionales bacterium]